MRNTERLYDRVIEKMDMTCDMEDEELQELIHEVLEEASKEEFIPLQEKNEFKLTAEELEEEAKYHMDAEAAPSVAKAIRLAVDYADENNLAGVVVCGSLYLAAQARPLLLKEAEK